MPMWFAYATPGWLGLFQRVRLALGILLGWRVLRPVLKFPNGTELDLSAGVVRVRGRLVLHADGDLILESERHVLVRSGVGGARTGDGRRYAVWLNPEIDENGRLVSYHREPDGSETVRHVWDDGEPYTLPR